MGFSPAVFNHADYVVTDRSKEEMVWLLHAEEPREPTKTTKQ